MTNIYVLNKLDFSFLSFFLTFLTFICLVLSISIIISKNPIFSVIFLILLFSCISIYLIFLGLNFIGISYLLVYVGAVSILFLFILMLINIRISELVTNAQNSIPLSILIIYIFINSINNFSYINIFYDFSPNNFTTTFTSSNNWDGFISDNYDIISIGNIMYTTHSIWLIITSIILLLAMVGAIVITINPVKNNIN